MEVEEKQVEQEDAVVTAEYTCSSEHWNDFRKSFSFHTASEADTPLQQPTVEMSRKPEPNP